MMTIKHWAGSLLLLAAFFNLSAQSNVKALVGGTLIDGFGGAPLHNSVVLIENETIKAIGQVGQLPIPANAEVISTEGMSVLPGLWEMHSHLMLVGHSDYAHWDTAYISQFRDVIIPAAAKQLLHAGVTSTRDLGGPLEELLYVREQINSGKMEGATIYTSGPFIQKKPYPGTEKFRWGVDGPEDARAKVRKLALAGVDCIKLIDQDQMSMEEVQAVVDEAHAHGLKVVAHSHRPEEIRRGLLAGIDCFEHTGQATAPEYPADVMELIKARTASGKTLFWTPTISVLWNYTYFRDNPEAFDDPAWKVGLPENIITDIRSSLNNPQTLPYYMMVPARKPTLRRKFEQLATSGAILMTGTDAGVPMTFHSNSTWRELDLWVRELGVSPLDAIKSATFWPAFFMGVQDKVGTLTPGKQADIIAVRGDVLQHINLLQNVDLVLKKGKRIK
jgi:imidazolonepropionase-like amidohydrolase